MPRKPALIDAIDQALDAQAFEFRVLVRLKYLEAVRDRKLDRSSLTRKPSITESVTRQPQFKPLDNLVASGDYLQFRSETGDDPELERAAMMVRQHCNRYGAGET